MSASVVFAKPSSEHYKSEKSDIERTSEDADLEGLGLVMKSMMGKDEKEAYGVSYFLNYKTIEENDELAMSTLRTIAVAAETYTTEHNGDYPLKIEDLTEVDEPFLGEKYCGETIDGFKYECEFAIDGYELVAIPVERRRTGTATFILTTRVKE